MRNERLSKFFGLSRAAWLVLPRVTMEHMGNEWQEKMAKLLEEHSETFPNQPPLSFHISAKGNPFEKNGNKFVKLPEYLCNYRHPDFEAIGKMKRQCDECHHHHDESNGFPPPDTMCDACDPQHTQWRPKS